MMTEEEQFLLDQLAYHLRLGEQDDMLRALFENDAWLHARLEGNAYNYDGYLADLMLSWECAQEQVEHHIRAGQEPSALAVCVRYALMRTSVNSLAENYQPQRVAQAVDLGLWSPRRGLSFAARVANSI